MGLTTEEITCPSCGGLCKIRKRNIYIWILYLVILIALGFITYGISIICLFFYLAIDRAKKNKPIQCDNCGYSFILQNNNYNSFSNNYAYHSIRGQKSYTVTCIVCGNEFIINVKDNFNSFACNKCKTIFSYEIIKGELAINVIKTVEFVPDNIRNIVKFFNLELPINKEILKKNYLKMIALYHPDKVAHLSEEHKKLSEFKTKEINKNYEIIIDWLENN